MTRPNSLEEFIGQADLKPLLEFNLFASKTRKIPFPHTLLTGGPGLGKTTLANIIASELERPIYNYMGSAIKTRYDVENIEKAISQHINSNSRPACECKECSRINGVQSCYHKAGYNCDGSVSDWNLYSHSILFIDEIHRVSTKNQELFYSMMEDRVYFTGIIDPKTGKESKYWIPLFTLIGATTNSGSLAKPFFDRFQLKLNLKNYSVDECVDIIKSSCRKEGVGCDDEAARDIATRSDGIPRVLINLSRAAVNTAIVMEKKIIDKKVAETMFNLNNIDGIGLPEIAHRILKILASIYPKSTGLENLSVTINEDAKYISGWVEPRLIQHGFIERTTKGRILTGKGMDYIRPFLNKEKEVKSAREI